MDGAQFRCIADSLHIHEKSKPDITKFIESPYMGCLQPRKFRRKFCHVAQLATFYPAFYPAIRSVIAIKQSSP